MIIYENDSERKNRNYQKPKTILFDDDCDCDWGYYHGIYSRFN